MKLLAILRAINYRLLMQRYSYANAGMAEWREVIEEATNDNLAGLSCLHPLFIYELPVH